MSFIEINHKGKFAYYLNHYLAVKQGLEEDSVNQLQNLHRGMLKLFDYMNKVDNVEILKNCVLSLEKIEFKMQKIWGFEQDRLMHTWWFQAPKCTCCKITNYRLFGVERVINPNCILHGE